jgi:hypothetical protein
LPARVAQAMVPHGPLVAAPALRAEPGDWAHTEIFGIPVAPGVRAKRPS